MKWLHLIGALGLIVIVTGCSDRRAFSLFSKRDRDVPASIAQTTDVKQAMMTDAGMASTEPAQTTLASATSTTSFTQPTLMTLPKGVDLDAQLNSASGPVILDFYADWCGPCRTQGRILHEMEGIAATNNTQIIKINVDEHPEIAKRLKVSSLPTLIVMKQGHVTKRVTGLTQQDELEQWMKL